MNPDPLIPALVALACIIVILTALIGDSAR